MNIYQENGYENREHYLFCLSEDFGVAIDEVFILAQVLSPTEDFDGLVVALEDYYA